MFQKKNSILDAARNGSLRHQMCNVLAEDALHQALPLRGDWRERGVGDAPALAARGDSVGLRHRGQNREGLGPNVQTREQHLSAGVVGRSFRGGLLRPRAPACARNMSVLLRAAVWWAWKTGADLCWWLHAIKPAKDCVSEVPTNLYVSLLNVLVHWHCNIEDIPCAPAEHRGAGKKESISIAWEKMMQALIGHVRCIEIIE